MTELAAVAALAFLAVAVYCGVVILVAVIAVILKDLWKIVVGLWDMLVAVIAAILFVVFSPITVPWLLWELWEEYKAARELELRLASLAERAELQKRAEAQAPRREPNPFEADLILPFEADLLQPEKRYTSDWGSVSNRYKKAQGWRCEHCGVYCGGPGDKPLLHVHHWDRNPQNNRDSNLVALCIQCHSRQPGEGHKRLRTASKKDGRWQRITRLREK